MLTGSALFTGVPIKLGPSAEHAFDTRKGAVLLCDPVTKVWIEQGATLLKAWGYSLAKQILESEDKTKKHGYFVVTEVHYTKRCLISCWSRKSESTSGGLDVGTSVAPLPSAELKGDKNFKDTYSGWVKCPGDQHTVRSSGITLTHITELARYGLCDLC